MSRDYARVSPGFWTGSTGRAIRGLGGNAQLLAMYLITSPHSTAIGLYSLPVAYVVADTGMTEASVRETLTTLREVGFCDYDVELEIVWVPEMARIQIGETLKPNDKRGPWILSTASKFKKHRFYRRFVLKYREPFYLRVSDEELPEEAPSMPLPRGFKPDLMPLRCQEQDQDQDQEQATENAPVAGAPDSFSVAKPKWLVHAEGPDDLTKRCLVAFDEGYATRSTGNRPLGVRGLYADLGTRVADASGLGDPVDVFREAGANLAAMVVASRKTDYRISNPWRKFLAEPIGAFLGASDDATPIQQAGTRPGGPQPTSDVSQVIQEIEGRLRAARALAHELAGEDGVREARAKVEEIRAELRQANARRDAELARGAA